MSGQAAPRTAPPPIPVTILTGFLGAGKTTLLNRLLKDPAFADTLVLVNEFGEIGLDHLLMESAQDGIIALSGGCLCCAVRSDLMAALEDLLRRRDNGRIAPFRRVVIETTGLADPAPVVHSFLAHPYLRLRYVLDGVVTVVDAVNGLATLAAHEEATKQVAVADRIVLTKTDLAPDAAALAALQERLAAIAPAARQLPVGAADGAALLDLGPWTADGRIPEVAQWLAPPTGQRAVKDHASGVRSTTLVSEEPLPPQAFDMFVDLLRSSYGARILRLKGLVRMQDDPARPVVIHGVQHLFHPPRRLERWPDEDHRTRLVVIAKDLDTDLVARIYDAFAGIPAIDTPDRAALNENPLAPPGLRGD